MGICHAIILTKRHCQVMWTAGPTALPPQKERRAPTCRMAWLQGWESWVKCTGLGKVKRKEWTSVQNRCGRMRRSAPKRSPKQARKGRGHARVLGNGRKERPDAKCYRGAIRWKARSVGVRSHRPFFSFFPRLFLSKKEKRRRGLCQTNFTISRQTANTDTLDHGEG